MSNNACLDPQPPYIFGYLSTQSKHFRIVACYQEVAANCKNWDPVYCTSMLIYCIAALVNEGLLAYVLIQYSKSVIGGSFWTKLKTWILIICMVMYAVEFIRNFFENINWKISLGLLYLEQICRLLAYVLICHFFLKAAANLVGKQTVKQWRKAVNIFTFVVLSFLSALLGLYIFDTLDPSGGRSVKACKSYEFMIQETLLMIIMCGFIYSATRIEKVITDQIEESKSLTVVTSNSTYSNIQKTILESRLTSLRSMWVIIYTMAFCAFFDFCYSVSVFIWYTPDCTPQRIPWMLDSFFKFCDRFIAYYIWLYPLLHTFWPSSRREGERQKYK